MANPLGVFALGIGAMDGPGPQGCAAGIKAPYDKSIEQNDRKKTLISAEFAANLVSWWPSRIGVGTKAHQAGSSKTGRGVVAVYRSSSNLPEE